MTVSRPIDRWLVGALVFGCLIHLLSAKAQAQIMVDGDLYRSVDDPFRDNRLVGVKERFHPELEPKGVGFGGITVLPELNIASEYVSNLLAVENGVADTVWTVTPAVEINIPTSKFDLTISGRFAAHRYQKRKRENNSEYGIKALAQIPVSSSYRIFLRGENGNITEPRTAIAAPINQQRPVQIERNFTGLHFQKTAGRLLAGVQVSAENLSFDRTDLFMDSALLRPHNGRSRNQFLLSANSEFSLSPDATVWGLIRARRIERKRDINLNSNGVNLAAGLRFKPSPLIEFAGALGYIEQYYAAPFRDVKGITMDARLKWLPTMLTTIGIGFSRKIDDEAAHAPRDFFVRELDITIDHELRRNLILDLSLGWMRYNLSDNQQTDRRFNLTTGALYRSDRNWTISARYARIKQSSVNAPRRFTQSRILFSVALAA